MMTKRLWAGSLAALLLCVSSLAAVCDLSCGFALFRSDCHSPQRASETAPRAEIAMAGMAMPGMSGDSSTDQRMVFSAPQAMPAHARLTEMGACARQSCAQAQALASKANHSTAVQFEAISTTARFSHAEKLRTVFQEARGGIAPLIAVVHSPLDVSLRI